MNWRLDFWLVVFAPVTLIGFIHIVNGIAVLAEPQAVRVSGLAGLLMFGLPPWPVIGFVLLLVGIWAVAARLCPTCPFWCQKWLAAPQQVVLIVQLTGILAALWAGQYPDGYIPVEGDLRGSRWFILGDQAALTFLCLSHALDMSLGHIINDRLIAYRKRITEMEKIQEAAMRLVEAYNETQFWTKFWDSDDNGNQKPPVP